MKLSKFLISCFLFSLIFINAYSAEQKQVPDYYFLSVEASNTQTKVFLNDVLLVSSDDGTGVKTEYPIATWLIPGKNTLTLELNPLPGEDTVRGEASANVYLHDIASDIPKAKKTYAALIFPEDKDLPIKGPLKKQISFEFTELTRVKLWSEAEDLTTVSDAEKKTIFETINTLKNALISNKSDEAVSLQDYKVHDDARSENKDPQRIKEVAKENYDWLAKQANLKSNSLVLEKTKFSIVANNKLLYVTDENGNNAIQLSSEDMYFEIPVYFARISGKWVLAR